MSDRQNSTMVWPHPLQNLPGLAGVPPVCLQSHDCLAGLRLETTDGQRFGFRQPVERQNGHGGCDITQPGDSTRPELTWQSRSSGHEQYVCLKVANTTPFPLQIKRLVVWQETVQPELRGELPAFYQPGWQTWSQAGAAIPPIQEPAPVKAVRLPQADNARDYFPSVTGIELGDTAWVWGFITAYNQTGLIEFDPRTRLLEAAAYADGVLLQPGETITSETLLLTHAPSLQAALERYGECLGKSMGAVSDRSRELWWCTWYERLAKIDADFVLGNLDWIKHNRHLLPVTGILIDQGHELNMGDWLETDTGKFPGGLRPIIDAVHAAGLQFGLWIAPLFFSENSRLYRAHPDWAVHDESGAPLTAKVLEGIEHYSLDASHPDALAWLKTMIEDAIALGVDLFKFDYLYAGAIAGRRDNPNVTGVQAYRQGIAAINDVLRHHPGVRTLGCGAPFAASVGLFSLMRTATDTVPYWPQPGDERYNLDGTQSGQRLTLQSLTARTWMRDWLWSPDSDAFVLRAHDNLLTLSEVYTQAILYWLNERFMTIGDDLTQLDAERLRIYTWLYPALGPWAHVVGYDQQRRANAFLYEPGDRPGRLLALVNWADDPREVTGPCAKQDYHVVDTQSGKYFGLLKQGGALTRRLAPHASLIVRLTEAVAHPQVVGANLHIAGGMAEIQSEMWDAAQGRLTVVFQSEGDHRGNVLISIPPGYELATPGAELQKGVLSLPIRLKHQQGLQLALCFYRPATVQA